MVILWHNWALQPATCPVEARGSPNDRLRVTAFYAIKGTKMIGSAVVACSLALIHLCSSRLEFLSRVPRRRWLSFAGGVSVAYAILHLLPELHDYTLELAELERPDSLRTARLIYMVTLFGLVVFYGLEKFALRSREKQKERALARQTSYMFWLHIASYTAYNGLIGYVLTQESRSILSLLSFLVGIGLHFVVNDHSLHAHHQELYRRYGRWCLSVAVLAGCTYGLLTAIHPILTAVSTAFLSGGILLNAFKEELPAERESHFGAFVTGTMLYAAITLVS